MAERSVLQNYSLAQTEVSIVERIVHCKGHNSEQVKNSDVVHFEIRDPNFKMRDIDDGSVFPSKRKNSNASPSHRMPYTGTQRLSFAFLQSQAMYQNMIHFSSKFSTKSSTPYHRTLLLLERWHPSVLCHCHFVLHLNENNCNGINRLEVILHPATKGRVEYYFHSIVVIRPSMNDSGRFLKTEPNTAIRRLKISEQMFEFVSGQRNGLHSPVIGNRISPLPSNAAPG